MIFSHAWNAAEDSFWSRESSSSHFSAIHHHWAFLFPFFSCHSHSFRIRIATPSSSRVGVKSCPIIKLLAESNLNCKFVCFLFLASFLSPFSISISCLCCGECMVLLWVEPRLTQEEEEEKRGEKINRHGKFTQNRTRRTKRRRHGMAHTKNEYIFEYLSWRRGTRVRCELEWVDTTHTMRRVGIFQAVWNVECVFPSSLLSFGCCLILNAYLPEAHIDDVEEG